MKNIIIIAVVLLMLGANMAQADDVLTDLLRTLASHRDPEVRKNAANMLGTLKIKAGVKPLIDSLSDSSQDVRDAAYRSLIKITEQDFPLNQAQWQKWWDEKGNQNFGDLSLASQELVRLKSWLNIAFVVMLLELVFIILFIIVFSFMGGAKIKEMKEINRRAEQYINDAEGASKRFEGIFDDIEKKRTELTQFFTKLREDNQNEIERFSDLIQQNIEHHLREASRNLREKSEAELKQTLYLLKDDLEHLIKKTVAEQTEKVIQQLKSKDSPTQNDKTV